ncbi:patatin-like phospholipase family protein [Tuberibacillus sp. Marseille-P3662]|uniref:patatin-like phospholipase family protein n=1 Tax=Tuberibacillus sp. Marseille-P3662 TaxID=1965358 RepID=UPI000A1CB3BD|nr:patatin family protein [Tuberibacillus sp. Marseille-P3662]
MQQTGLVLEGGGMRGIYSAGVLEFFMENNLYFPYVIGVSAGACMAASYVSRQPGRNKIVNIDYADHPDYISFKNWLFKKQLFGMDLIFDAIPNQHEPFDYDTFFQRTETFVIGTTDCHTGNSVYFDHFHSNGEILTALKASSSIPYMAPIVQLGNYDLLDGGISDPIPLKKSIHDGQEKNVVILTKNEGYRKTKPRLNSLLKWTYKSYPGLKKAIMNRHHNYNQTLDEIAQSPDTFVIQPSEPLEVSRIERSKEKLQHLHDMGYRDAERLYPKLKAFLE